MKEKFKLIKCTRNEEEEVCVRVCLCVCVRERERERERKKVKVRESNKGIIENVKKTLKIERGRRIE